MKILTPRENHLMHAMMSYKTTTGALSQELGITPDCVKAHLSNIYRKLGVKNMTQAAVKFYKENYR